MKMASSADAIRKGWLASESWNALALPVNVDVRPGGSPSDFSLALIASTAWPRDLLGARLNDRVTAGNWPSWLTVSGADERSRVLIARRGTGAPLLEGT